MQNVAELPIDAEALPPRRRALHVDQAPDLVARSVTPIADTEKVPLRRAGGRVLCMPIRSPISLPPFDHSAVDGFGVRSDDATRPETVLPVTAHTLAGGSKTSRLEREAVRIMTGAPIPLGCDSVVKREHVVDRSGTIVLTDTVHRGANIRRAGEDVAPGTELVGRGALLDARHIALLAACGVASVQVVRKINIAILAFGNELRSPGKRLGASQIFDSNSAMAGAFLNRPLCQIIVCARAGDDRRRAAELLSHHATDADFIIASGGMADGDADFTRFALLDAGGDWKDAAFNLKPGRPARLGTLGTTTVLGLPGNPFAALVALLVLGVPIIDRLTGATRPVHWLAARAGFDLQRQPGHTELFPARIRGAGTNSLLTIERLGKGGSARLSPLVGADGLGRIDEAHGSVTEGESLSFLPFMSVFH